MLRVGLDSLEVAAIFNRTFPDAMAEEPLMRSIAKAVGEVIEENNRRLWEMITKEKGER